MVRLLLYGLIALFTDPGTKKMTMFILDARQPPAATDGCPTHNILHSSLSNRIGLHAGTQGVFRAIDLTVNLTRRAPFAGAKSIVSRSALMTLVPPTRHRMHSLANQCRLMSRVRSYFTGW
jgi:hypothetical protein